MKVPVCSVGEENLVMQRDRHYPDENILVHEFGHSVMNLGLTKAQRKKIVQQFATAKMCAVYKPGCYMMKNAQEYWAEGVQAYFEATARRGEPVPPDRFCLLCGGLASPFAGKGLHTDFSSNDAFKQNCTHLLLELLCEAQFCLQQCYVYL